MRIGTRVALVAGAAAVSIAVGLPLASAGPAPRGPQSTYLLRGTVVQYIAPAGSMVGSLSIRVTRAGGAGAKRLTGELVTVAIQPGDASIASQLVGVTAGSSFELALKAQSSASILKGGGALRTLVAQPTVTPPAPGPAPAPVDAAPADKAGSGDGSQAGTKPADAHPSGDQSDGGSHSDGGSGSSGHGSGKSK
jgi:hypothetical protein